MSARLCYAHRLIELRLGCVDLDAERRIPQAACSESSVLTLRIYSTLLGEKTTGNFLLTSSSRGKPRLADTGICRTPLKTKVDSEVGTHPNTPVQ